MKVKNIMDYFGPRLNCYVKLHYLGQTGFIFESDGFDYPEDDEILESYVIEIGIEEDDGINYLDLTLEA
ncbi:MAG: hypothetical protein J6Y78_15700 [Paludibacteraceae bacterium]|nr:hypothetical protein [Paludibacteraceae bacterium]